MTNFETNKVLSSKDMKYFPFNYKYLSTTCESKNAVKILHRKIGKMEAVQNENAYLETYYKNISRF